MTEAEAKLVRMALEIRQFFQHQGDAADTAAANHIRQFWSRQMRQDFLSAAESGDPCLDQQAHRVAAALAASDGS